MKISSQPISGRFEDKNSPFRLYKWAIILFNIAFLYECVIVFGFWCIILPGILFANPSSAHSSGGVSTSFIVVAGALDHSLPLIVLLFEFCINCIPIIWRHFAISVVLGTAYMIMNMTYSLLVREVYPIMDWRVRLGLVCR